MYIVCMCYYLLFVLIDYLYALLNMKRFKIYKMRGREDPSKMSGQEWQKR
jgi:hypothetical protein